MLKIFRNIRKSLVMENKSTKYLKYAVGEIILVVIGILIALQINNWKQKQNNKVLTISYLEDFKKDLINDTIIFNKAIKRATNTIKKDQAILKINAFESINSDSLYNILRVHHSMRIYQINNSTYSKLLNTGFTEAKEYRELFNTINLYYTVEYKIYGEYIEWDKEQTIDMNDSAFLTINSIDLSVLDENTELNHINHLDEETRAEIIEFILSNTYRNRLFADYTRKSRVVERILIQKELAADLLKQIDKRLKIKN
ncbi:hypothetical protein C1T31_03920 [Hanstruepera neustonica]|uniref:Uncharacterized protein n=1 Tax=Hanstruepera neustonica TaxID=1445657 RepID=A0A2K1E4T2_9FLAO|nr:DUF6090 family protein [Hanstruepera neustonica]PNQ75289.1 hypothetical protein C1T31_03920 [Hanstruepera neustonica]